MGFWIQQSSQKRAPLQSSYTETAEVRQFQKSQDSTQHQLSVPSVGTLLTLELTRKPMHQSMNLSRTALKFIQNGPPVFTYYSVHAVRGW